jgi:hypothetical protein
MTRADNSNRVALRQASFKVATDDVVGSTTLVFDGLALFAGTGASAHKAHTHGPVRRG